MSGSLRVPGRDCIAVLNAGSSSIKFAIYDAGAGAALRLRGQAEGIGASPRLKVRDARAVTVVERVWPDARLDHAGATRAIAELAPELLEGARIVAVGHRVVHGGTGYAAPVRITPTKPANLRVAGRPTSLSRGRSARTTRRRAPR